MKGSVNTYASGAELKQNHSDVLSTMARYFAQSGFLALPSASIELLSMRICVKYYGETMILLD